MGLFDGTYSAKKHDDAFSLPRNEVIKLLLVKNLTFRK
jgi:hypothetical protein